MHRIWMPVNGIAFSLVEVWKAVSVTLFCSGCMNNNDNDIPILLSLNSTWNNLAWIFIADYLEQDVT